ncbi:MAG TPA: acyltransferase [Myxococcales bacterium]|nr:acyltransferase [Myxococcales bacterium]
MQDNGARIASLDGLRAVAILMVVGSHITGSRDVPSWYGHLFPVYFGRLGVRVFFVLSGYLITRLLLMEHRETGSIRLGMFYFRRTFRILVPYYAFLIAVYGAWRLGWIQLAQGDLEYAVVYLTDYHPHGAWTLGHTWSLAVEEQFYLLWPAILVLLGVKRSTWVAAAYLLAAPFLRLFIWHFHPESDNGIGHTFFTSADPIAIGCLLAIVSDKLWHSARYRAVLSSRWILLVPPLVVAAGSLDSHPRIAFTLGTTIINVGVAIWLDRCLRMPWRFSTRLLSQPVLVGIGRISYSLYLWQQLFIDRLSTGWANAFPRCAILAGLTAVASFFLIEKPSLSARVALQAWLGRVLPRRPILAAPRPGLSPPAERAA